MSRNLPTLGVGGGGGILNRAKAWWDARLYTAGDSGVNPPLNRSRNAHDLHLGIDGTLVARCPLIGLR